MLGAIIGDIVGSRFEWNNYRHKDFELFTNESHFTDDTVLTCAVAQAAVTRLHYPDKETVYRDTIYQYANNFPNVGYGPDFHEWMKSVHPEPYNSFGNGSAMRVSAIGWLFDDRDTVLREAQLSAECTHNHPEGIKAAVCIADCIYLLHHEKYGRYRLLQHIQRYYYSPKKYPDMSKSVEQIRANNKFNASAQVTVPQAIRCFLEGNDFEDIIRTAVSIGGDSDTIAAIAGSLAEAESKIPEKIIAQALEILPSGLRVAINHFNEMYQHLHMEETKSRLTEREREEYINRRAEFCNMYEERDYLIHHEQQNILALFIELIGRLQFELFTAETKLQELRMKSEFLQQSLAKNEKPDKKQIKQAIHHSLQEAYGRIRRQHNDMIQAHQVIVNGVTSDEVIKEFKDIYRTLIKRLHPLLHPNQNDSQKDLFLQAQAAYKMIDIHKLRELILHLGNDILSDKELDEESNWDDRNKQIEKEITHLRYQIKEMDNNFPLNLRKNLADGKWINQKQEEFKIKFNSIEKQIESEKEKIELIQDSLDSI